MNRFSKTRSVLGDKNFQKIRNLKIIIFGIGGVGSYTAEILARSGVEKITLVDYDRIDISNINRQVMALESTVGMYKVDVMKERLLDINPNIIVTTHKLKYNKYNYDKIDLMEYDYIVDAIDTITSKLVLIEESKKKNLNIVSSMGAANKIDPTKIKVSDIYDTEYCPLARVIRKELRARKIKDLKVVWSDEISKKAGIESKNNRKFTPASTAFVPPAFGITIASTIIKDLLQEV